MIPLPSGGQVDANCRVDINEQKTFLATSSDGIHFRVSPVALGPAYFRVFHWADYYGAIVRAGIVLGLVPCERHLNLVQRSFRPMPVASSSCRRRGERRRAPSLRPSDWGSTGAHLDVGDSLDTGLASMAGVLPVDVLIPERDYEGAQLPLEVSAPDEAPGRVRQLRDPGIFSENQRTYLCIP